MSGGLKRNVSYGSVPTTGNSQFNKRSKSPVRLSEKNVSLLIDIFPSNCSSRELTLASYTDTWTCAIAAIQSGRIIMAVEEDPFCIELTGVRLQGVAKVFSQQMWMAKHSKITSTAYEKRVSCSQDNNRNAVDIQNGDHCIGSVTTDTISEPGDTT